MCSAGGAYAAAQSATRLISMVQWLKAGTAGEPPVPDLVLVEDGE